VLLNQATQLVELLLQFAAHPQACLASGRPTL
jgi:hypothetical protein